MILIRINTPSVDVATQIAEAAITRRLAACANIEPPIRSLYHWLGRVESAEEVPLILKTRDTHFDAVAALVEDIHPDETPAILAIPVAQTTRGFEDWLLAETEAG